LSYQSRDGQVTAVEINCGVLEGCWLAVAGVDGSGTPGHWPASGWPVSK
jgi:hypothetical protein